MNDKIQKPLIFISHRSEDADLAEAFREAIESDFLEFPEVYLATAMKPGIEWEPKIKTSLQRAFLVCVLCSERLESHWVSMEIGAAWVRDVELIPICYGNRKRSDLPGVLKKLQALEARSDEDLGRLYAEIAEKLNCAQPPVSATLKENIALFHEKYEPLSAKERYERQPDGQRAEKYELMADGTVKAINPMTGTLVWTVQARRQRPFTNAPSRAPNEVDQTKSREDHCPFCETRYYETTPERSRIEKARNRYVNKTDLPAEAIFENRTAEFRRVPNLFAFLSYDYWKSNYGYRPSRKNLHRQKKYLGTEEGRRHVAHIIKQKRKLTKGAGPDDETMKKSLFSESHDLIIARRHLKPNAKFDNEHVGAGDLAIAEHYHYFRITIDAAKDLFAQNRFVEYVAVFQNWLRQSGATIDHLHKQLAGIDEYGLPIDRALHMKSQNPKFFSERINFAAAKNLILAENEHAVAYIDPGRRYPTIAICSKYLHTFLDAQAKSVKGMSDLVLACHAAIGSDQATNEEWYYTPPRAEVKIPWLILILHRANVLAGFEHATRIHLNPYRPEDLKSDLTGNLEKLKNAGDFKSIDIGQVSREYWIKY